MASEKSKASKVKKHPGGRPSKYTKELLKKCEHYIDHWQEEKGIVIPTITGLALHLGIAEATIYDWAGHKDKQEFSENISQIKRKQVQVLKNSGLSGTFNAKITTLLLSRHDVIERKETQRIEMEVSTTQMTDEQLQEIAGAK